jgi:hypothetical protein
LSGPEVTTGSPARGGDLGENVGRHGLGKDAVGDDYGLATRVGEQTLDPRNRSGTARPAGGGAVLSQDIEDQDGAGLRIQPHRPELRTRRYLDALPLVHEVRPSLPPGLMPDVLPLIALAVRIAHSVPAMASLALGDS